MSNNLAISKFSDILSANGHFNDCSVTGRDPSACACFIRLVRFILPVKFVCFSALLQNAVSVHSGQSLLMTEGFFDECVGLLFSYHDFHASLNRFKQVNGLVVNYHYSFVNDRIRCCMELVPPVEDRSKRFYVISSTHKDKATARLETIIKVHFLLHRWTYNWKFV